MHYTITYKNRTQILSKQAFNKRLVEALQQNCCNTNDRVFTALKMSNEILYSGATLKIRQLYFTVKYNTKIKPFVGKQRA